MLLLCRVVKSYEAENFPENMYAIIEKKTWVFADLLPKIAA